MSSGVNRRLPLAFFFGLRIENSLSQKRIKEVFTPNYFPPAQPELVYTSRQHTSRIPTDVQINLEAASGQVLGRRPNWPD